MRAASSFDSLPLPLVPARENATSMAVSSLANGATDGTAVGLGVVAGTGVWATAANATLVKQTKSEWRTKLLG